VPEQRHLVADNEGVEIVCAPVFKVCCQQLKVWSWSIPFLTFILGQASPLIFMSNPCPSTLLGRQVESVELTRLGGNAVSSKTFDLVVRTKSEVEHQFRWEGGISGGEGGASGDGKVPGCHSMGRQARGQIIYKC
jgi:hypothetical protein